MRSGFAPALHNGYWGRGGAERSDILKAASFLAVPAAFCFASTERPVKFALVQRHKKSQARFHRRGVFIQFMPVERVTGLGAQRVPRSQARRLEAGWPACLQNLVPKRFGEVRRGNNLKSVLARVAGSRDKNRLS